jgi:hypothetical protein
VRDYLDSLLIHINAAPSSRQDRNGLVERHWQTMLAMACNWLASAELLGTFWYYAICRVAEVCKYFPYRLEDGSFTTPLELVHKVKPDLRVLFPMFGLAAVRWEHVRDSQLNKFDSQSIYMIAVGRCQQSNGLQFYNSSNCTFVSSIDYKFRMHSTSGVHFGYNTNQVFSSIVLTNQPLFLSHNFNWILKYLYILLLHPIELKLWVFLRTIDQMFTRCYSLMDLLVSTPIPIISLKQFHPLRQHPSLHLFFRIGLKLV